MGVSDLSDAGCALSATQPSPRRCDPSVREPGDARSQFGQDALLVGFQPLDRAVHADSEDASVAHARQEHRDDAASGHHRMTGKDVALASDLADPRHQLGKRDPQLAILLLCIDAPDQLLDRLVGSCAEKKPTEARSGERADRPGLQVVANRMG